MKGHSGKKAVNRHQTQSKASAGSQERAIERKERQVGRKVIAAEELDRSARRQCAKCPWRKDVDPHDIPNGYCEVKHANLKNTIAEPGSIRDLGGTMRVMACHEFPEGKESPCVGWVMHQLGTGNNIALRMQALDGRFKGWRTVGEQHERFEDTLPQ